MVNKYNVALLITSRGILQGYVNLKLKRGGACISDRCSVAGKTPLLAMDPLYEENPLALEFHPKKPQHRVGPPVSV